MHRIAVLSDIHGNVWALEAVLADISTQGVDRLVNLGDSLYGPLAPRETASLLEGLEGVTTVRGNQDRLLEGGAAGGSPFTIRYVLEQVESRALRWFQDLEDSLELPNGLFLCHGTPESDQTPLLERLSPEGGALEDDATIRGRLGTVAAAVVLCGHSHVPRVVRLKDGRLIVNPGSVGLPAYSEDIPVKHKMEAGSPHARYSILEERPDGWRVAQVSVAYPWDRAARMARDHGRPDWATWLETGRA